MAAEIVALAEEVGAGLILVGIRGWGRLRRALRGSVSESVVRHAHCPVLVVRGGQGAWPPTRMVVGNDGSEDAKGTGELAAAIGKLFGIPMLVVRTYLEPPMPLMLPEYEQDLYYRLIEETRRRGEKALEDRAVELSELLGRRPGIKLAMDDPASAILEAAGEEESVLVAVGSRGLGAVRRVLLGSVSAKVLRAAWGSVLIYPHLTEKKRSGRA